LNRVTECDSSAYAPPVIRIFEVAQLQQGCKGQSKDAAPAGLARSICKAPEPMFHISRLHFKKVICHFFTLFDMFPTFSIAESTGCKLFTLHSPQPTPLLLLRRSYDFRHAPSTCSEALLDHRCVGRGKAGCVLLPAGGFATIGNRLVARTVDGCLESHRRLVVGLREFFRPLRQRHAVAGSARCPSSYGTELHSAFS
jgi:hypothetical protein